MGSAFNTDVTYPDPSLFLDNSTNSSDYAALTALVALPPDDSMPVLIPTGTMFGPSPSTDTWDPYSNPGGTPAVSAGSGFGAAVPGVATSIGNALGSFLKQLSPGYTVQQQQLATTPYRSNNATQSAVYSAASAGPVSNLLGGSQSFLVIALVAVSAIFLFGMKR